MIYNTINWTINWSSTIFCLCGLNLLQEIRCILNLKKIFVIFLPVTARKRSFNQFVLSSTVSKKRRIEFYIHDLVDWTVKFLKTWNKKGKKLLCMLFIESKIWYKTTSLFSSIVVVVVVIIVVVVSTSWSWSWWTAAF